MTKKIAFLGGPGSGKSTQCAHLFSILKSKSIQTEQIQEWVREAFNKKMIPNNAWSQFLIYEEQKKKEGCVPANIDYIITDSPTLLSYVYALNNANIEEDKWLIINMYEKFIHDLREYDYIFFCAREKQYIRDGTRVQTLEEAKNIDFNIRTLLNIHKVKYILLEGTTEERTNQILDIIGVKA